MKANIIKVFLFLLVATMVSCSKGGGGGTPPPVNPPPAATPPTIATMAPDNGVFNTVVTITGTNFSTTLADNEVKFNNKIARLTGEPDLSFAGFQDGDPSVAKFMSPSDMCADAQGNLYIADFNNQRIRKVSFE